MYIRKVLVLALWLAVGVWVFAQDGTAEPPAAADSGSAPASEEPPAPEETPGPDNPPEEPSPSIASAVGSGVVRYFQWGKAFAVRKDFILSTLSFVWDADRQGIREELFTIHWSFLPFMSVGVGLEVRGLFGEPAGFPGFAGLTAQAGFVLPITAKIKTFGDVVAEFGYSTARAEANVWLGFSIGFDAGVTVMVDTDFGLEFKYTGIALPNGGYQNALGFGWLWNFWL